MQPYRKSFAGDPLFPFEIVYKTIKYPDNELPDHLHDHYELVYVHSGQGIFFIDNCWYQKSAGDLFVIPGNTIHHSLPDLEDPIVSSAIFFAPSLIAGPLLGDGYFPLQCYEIARKKAVQDWTGGITANRCRNGNQANRGRVREPRNGIP